MRNSLSVVRLIVEGLRDGVVDARMDRGIVDQMLPHVQLLGDLLDEQARSGETRCGAPSERPLQIGPLLEQWSHAMRAKADQRCVDLRVVIAECRFESTTAAPDCPRSDMMCRSTRSGRRGRTVGDS
ncbi:MAG: hypothetical protein ACR2LH_08930 [Thermoleophilaceae bacterium]